MHIGTRYLEVLYCSLVILSRLALAKPLGHIAVCGWKRAGSGMVIIFVLIIYWSVLSILITLCKNSVTYIYTKINQSSAFLLINCLKCMLSSFDRKKGIFVPNSLSSSICRLSLFRFAKSKINRFKPQKIRKYKAKLTNVIATALKLI